jgi:FkbM family methyltransferase
MPVGKIMSRGMIRHLRWRLFPPRQATLDGVIVALSHLPLTARMKRRICSGGYEQHERRLLPGFMEKGDHVLEIGASVGIISSLLLKGIGPTGRVVAVEANKALAAPFRRQLEVNGLACDLVTSACVPIWGSEVAVNGFVSLHPTDNSLEGRIAGDPDSGFGAVPLRSAGDICRELDFTPNALVCDIEGSERVWIDHAEAIPATIDKMLVEFHPWIDGPEAAGQCLAALGRAGFGIRAFSGTVFDLRRTPHG